MESPQTIVGGIFATPTYRCRVSLPLTAGPSMASEVFRTLNVGETVTAISAPCFVDGHARVRVRLEDGSEGFVSVHSNDTFFLIEVLPLDDANPFRWNIP